MKYATDLLIFVLYDGIENSVFSSQVVKPLLQKIEDKKYKKIIIISFEKNKPSNLLISGKIKNNKYLELIICSRLPFFGKLSLLPAIYQLKKILKTKKKYTLIARGPLAGFVCLKAIYQAKCKSLTIQARGLLAQEHKYFHKDEKSTLKKMLCHFRFKQFEALEKMVYKESTQNQKINIETVSIALKNYIIKKLNANNEKITVATDDIPDKIETDQIKTWKKEIQKKLNIKPNQTIYCYNGSIKPWQCPQKVVNFFKNKIDQNKNVFLLVLTQDKDKFSQLISKKNIDAKYYSVQTVKHCDIYKYLSACDYGLIFREKNIINWVSRPTKILEYNAVGIKIIHNNTIEYLKNSTSLCSFTPK